MPLCHHSCRVWPGQCGSRASLLTPHCRLPSWGFMLGLCLQQRQPGFTRLLVCSASWAETFSRQVFLNTSPAVGFPFLSAERSVWGSLARLELKHRSIWSQFSAFLFCCIHMTSWKDSWVRKKPGSNVAELEPLLVHRFVQKGWLETNLWLWAQARHCLALSIC